MPINVIPDGELTLLARAHAPKRMHTPHTTYNNPHATYPRTNAPTPTCGHGASLPPCTSLPQELSAARRHSARHLALEAARKSAAHAGECACVVGCVETSLDTVCGVGFLSEFLGGESSSSSSS